METIDEKITRYRQVILNFLNERAAIKIVNRPGCEHVVIADTERNHYQLLTIGWTPTQYVHSLSFHLDIEADGKIWLRANWTDTDIAQVLVERGVAKSDIVLGFYPIAMRELSEYAVA